MMDYPCGKFGDCSFCRFGFIVRTNLQTDRQTDTDAAKCYTFTTAVGVSDELKINQSKSLIYGHQRLGC